MSRSISFVFRFYKNFARREMRKGLCCIFQRCCVSITRPTRGIERRDGPSGPYLVQYHAETPDCRNKLRTHVRMYYARARGIQYRKFGIFTNGTIGWDSVINTELVCAFSCEAPRWIRNVEKHSKVSLNRGLVEKPSFIDRSNSIVCNEGPFPSFFFLTPREYLLSMTQRWFFF